MDCVYFVVFIIASIVAITSAKPIMVSYGTNQGPIVPPLPSSTPRLLPEDYRQPAPVSERVDDDIPNPVAYKPPVPVQYRYKLLGYRPNPNLIVGSARDQKFFGSSYKFSLYKREQARALGLDYRGPQYFDIQQYEIEREQKRLAKELLLDAYAEHRSDYTWINNQKEVPEIGVVYSSGLKYYVPQLVVPNQDAPIENEVYDRNDKYQYYKY